MIGILCHSWSSNTFCFVPVFQILPLEVSYLWIILISFILETLGECFLHVLISHSSLWERTFHCYLLYQIVSSNILSSLWRQKIGPDFITGYLKGLDRCPRSTVYSDKYFFLVDFPENFLKLGRPMPSSRYVISPNFLLLGENSVNSSSFPLQLMPWKRSFSANGKVKLEYPADYISCSRGYVPWMTVGTRSRCWCSYAEAGSTQAWPCPHDGHWLFLPLFGAVQDGMGWHHAYIEFGSHFW